MSSDKFSKGLNLFRQVHGGLAAEETVNKLQKISPQLARYSIEWIFGDLYADQTLDMKAREISNLSALVALGALPQLKNHIYSALSVGFSPKEIEQVILNNIIIVGFPPVVNAMLVLQEVLSERSSSDGRLQA